MIYYDLVPRDFTATQQARSEYVARHWTALAKNVEVKRAFERLAEEEKMEHAVNHPGYKYAPGKSADGSAMSPVTVPSGRVASLRTRSSALSDPPAPAVPSSHVVASHRSDRITRTERVSRSDSQNNEQGGKGQESLYSLFPGTFASMPKSVSIFN